MTFQDAVEEMKVLAGRRTWAFEYEVNSYSKGVQIHGYIESDKLRRLGHAKVANTYAEAIRNVKMMLDPMPIDDAPEDDAPEDDEPAPQPDEMVDNILDNAKDILMDKKHDKLIDLPSMIEEQATKLNKINGGRG